MTLTLIIGNKNYSSWSLRPWLFLKHHGIAFEEIRIPLYREDSQVRIAAYSPAGKVPVLVDGDVTVWDSLAILEYLAERFPETQGWPAATTDRARARSLAAEMHSGFAALRTHCGMNCRRQPAPKALPAAVDNDVARIRQIWRECREHRGNDGPWLFGRFTVVDAMYAPVALRFHTYRVEAGPAAQDYVNTVLGHPAVTEWIVAGKAETEVIPAFEE
ncbi:glutathione S-transferase family protein [Methylolobus aquaticus]|nr:glutathione S-transferase family protein [Methylolobus aquaticus]